MAVFRQQVFYDLLDRNKWSNVYHIEADGLLDAAIGFEANMRDDLLGLLHPSAQLKKVLWSSLDDDTFLERPYGLLGLNGDTDELLPLWNVARVFFQTAGLGRPDLKFLKGLVTEDANESGFLASSVITHITTVFGSIISAMSSDGTPLCSENGDLWANVSVDPLIGMRQMHRRRRRAVTPTP